MKILVDENIPLKSVQALREIGYEVLDIRGTPTEGVTDEVLWEIVQKEKNFISFPRSSVGMRIAPLQRCVFKITRTPLPLVIRDAGASRYAFPRWSVGTRNRIR